MKHKYKIAIQVFKALRAEKWVHEKISRAKAIGAIVRVLEQDPTGDIPVPRTSCPCIPPFLDTKRLYSEQYLNRAFGTNGTQLDKPITKIT